MLYPLFALAAILMYQATNPAIYYMIGVGIYLWAYTEGEVSMPTFSKLGIEANEIHRLSATKPGPYPAGRVEEW
jgi:thymine-DNA glycosylase